MPSTSPHPEERTLQAFVQGQLAADVASWVSAHIAQCNSCQQWLLAENSRFADATTQHPADGATIDWVAGSPDESIGVALPWNSGGVSPPSGAERVPTFVGEYEVLSEIARGGMGVVYKARHRRLGRVAALKLIKAGEFAEEDEIRRFQKEAEAASQLDHPNIVPLFEIGRFAGRHFMALAFIDGRSLADAIQATPLDPQQSAAILIQVSESIHYAHQRGIIHRDLKPQNVLLTADGSPKVTDFGLAKSLHGDSSLTGTGAIVGTPSYMSPEQAIGNSARVGVAADVYSLGATLYATLTGRPPFAAASPWETIKQVLDHEPISPRALNPSIPTDLEAICLKAIEKEPARRYGSAQLLAEDLGRFLRGEPTLARPLMQVERAWRWCRRNRLLSGAVSAVAISLLLGIVVASIFATRANQFALQAKQEAEKTLRQEERTKQQRDRVIQQLYFTKIAREEARIQAGESGKALDHLRQIPLSQRGWEHRFLTRSTEGSVLTMRGHTNSVKSVCFTPDGHRLVSGARDGFIRIWNVRTGEQEQSFDVRPAQLFSVAVSPDGNWLASGSNDGAIRLWNLPGSELVHTLPAHLPFVYSVAFSPDSKRLVSGGEDRLVRVWEVSTGQQLHALSGHQTFVPAVSFSIDGLLIASSDREQTVKIWDAKSGQELRTLIGKEHILGEVAKEASVSFSPDGGRLATAWESGAILWNPHTGEMIRQGFKTRTRVGCTSFSPNGIYLACGTSDGNSRQASIAIFDSRFGNELRVLRGHQHDITSLSISPDSNLLASASNDGVIKLWDLRTGSNSPLLIQPRLKRMTKATLSKDGSRLIGCDEAGVLNAWDAKSGVPLQQWTGHETEFQPRRLQSDGRWAVTSGKDDIAIWDLSSPAKHHKLAGTANSMTRTAFSPVESILATASNRAIKLWDLETGVERQTLSCPPVDVTELCFSPDGRWLAAGTVDRMVHVWETGTGKLRFASETFEASNYLDAVTAIAFHPDLDRMVVGNFHGSIKVLDTASGRHMASIAGHEGAVNALAFSPDGCRLFSAGRSSARDQGMLRLWDFASGAELLVLEANHREVLGLMITPDGDRVITTGVDGQIKIWDARVQTQSMSFFPHPSVLSSLTLSSTGKRLATGTLTGVVKIWNVEDATEQLELAKCPAAIAQLAFNEEATMLAVRDAQGGEIYWDLESQSRLSRRPALESFTTHLSLNQGKVRAYPEERSAVVTFQHQKDYDPWFEYFSLKDSLERRWHAEDAAAARQANDWFANRFHLACESDLASSKGLNAKPALPPSLASAPFDAQGARELQAAWARQLGLPVEVTNSLGMKLRLIPPGEFTMGMSAEYAQAIAMLSPNDSHWGELARSSAPQHVVRITQPFYLASCEVTQGQYEQIMGTNPAGFSATGDQHEKVRGLDTRDHPVERVTFLEANEFCARLRKLSHHWQDAKGKIIDLPTKRGSFRFGEYRLPSEAEWEWACAAGTMTLHSHGPFEADLRSYASYSVNSGRQTQRVGQLKPNAWGLFDMHGNVWERCGDGFDAGEYASRSEKLVDNPRRQLGEGLGVVRGGSWFDTTAGCCTSLRFAFPVAERTDNSGFRVALPLVEE